MFKGQRQSFAQFHGHLGNWPTPAHRGDPDHIHEAGRTGNVLLFIRTIGRQPQIERVQPVAGQRRGDGGQYARPINADHADFIVLPAERTYVDLDGLFERETSEQPHVTRNFGRRMPFEVAFRHAAQVRLDERRRHAGALPD